MGTSPLVLASASPRRRMLLRQAGLSFQVFPADVDERALPDERPEAHVRRLAALKAATVARLFPEALVLGADTVVVLDERILGKPATVHEAMQMLKELSGRRHRVLTGVCLRRLQPRRRVTIEWVASTTVWFKRLSGAVVDEYCRRVYTLDKAGAYAIQEAGDLLVQRIEGHESNVIGLPVEDLLERLSVL